MKNQFARLLAEIKAVGLTAEQSKDLCASMDCDTEFLQKILDAAEEEFERMKGELNPEVLLSAEGMAKVEAMISNPPAPSARLRAAVHRKHFIEKCGLYERNEISFAEILKAAIEDLGMLPQDLADRCSVGASTLTRWMDGNVAPMKRGRDGIVRDLKLIAERE